MSTILRSIPAPGIVLLTLNRPEVLNAMSPAMCDELVAELAKAGSDSEARVVVLTGAGRGFSAGHDLGDLDPSTVLRGPISQLEHQERFAAVIQAVRATPIPVIAAVNGAAAGAGLAIALASDVRICSESARFNAAFVRLGLSGCDLGVSYFLPKVVGVTLAFEMMLTGRLVAAEEALRSGLVLDVVADDGVVSAAVTIAQRIAQNSPWGIRETKRVMWANLDSPNLEAALELENRTQSLCALTDDCAEAVAAFVDKRPAVFTRT